MTVGSDRTGLATALLAPPSIALIGASDDPAKTAGRPLRFLRASGYRGRVYPVNPNRDTVLGERAWPSLTSLPEVPVHAFILTGTDSAVTAVAECGKLGVQIATVLAGGFAEAGPDGAERERRLAAVARETGIRLLGPNSLGAVNPGNGLVLTANAAFAEPNLPSGRTFVASQSGSIIGALVSRGIARGIGFAGLVSTGGEVDLTVGELCLATVDDPAVGGYALFLETLRGADRLHQFAREAASRGKPVLVYKLGRSAAGAELAVSHTGALAGTDDVAAAFLADNGMARVDTIEALLEGGALAPRLPLRAPGSPAPRIGVVTTTGGGAAMVVDQLGARGIDVTGPGPATLAELRSGGIDVAESRIIDLTLAGARPEVMTRALDILLGCGEYDLLIAVIGSSARFHPELAVQPVAAARDRKTPIAAFLVPEAPEALRLLTDNGIASFRTPESCADAVAALLRRRVPGLAPAVSADTGGPAHARTVTGTAGETNLTGGSAPAGLADLPVQLDEQGSYEILDQLGIARTPTAVVHLETDGELAAGTTIGFDFPVAAKVLDAAIAHKSDLGGVVLGIADIGELREAARRISQSVAAARPGTTVDRIIVQPMASGVGEVLLGYRTDPDVGPVVVLAVGGLLAELVKDRSIRTAPVTAETAREMIAEVPGLDLLRGFRGAPPADLEALADAVVALSTLAARPSLRVLELEVNPLLVLPAGHGVLALDGTGTRTGLVTGERA